MDRKKALALVLGGTILAAGAIGTAVAQQPPPPLPSTFYGDVDVPGVQAGDPVIAIMGTANGSGACGAGAVLNDAEAGLVYVVDVKAQESLDDPFCGMTGRTVRFYFPRQHLFAEETGSWATGLRPERDLTAGDEVGNVNFAPNSSYAGRN